MPKDLCVICGKETPYDFNTHIDLRVGYVEGAGQGCYSPNTCNKLNKTSTITIDIDLVYNTPNDQELGAKVRELYWQSKQK